LVIAPAHRVKYNFADYLALEASSNVKHEFLDGQIYGMTGGTPERAALKAAVTGLLFGQVRGGKCRVHDSDLRVRVLETGLATYPDVTVVCGPRELDPADSNTVTNPTLIVEVLSHSTEEYDRGDKFEHYKRVPTLMQYVLVSQGDASETFAPWSSNRSRGPNNSLSSNRLVAMISTLASEMTGILKLLDQPGAELAGAPSLIARPTKKAR
jgi:Uma2 family endonuclease